MVRSCCVRGCSNSSKIRSLFRIPSVVKEKGDQTEEITTRRRREWIAQLRLKNISFETTTVKEVCADHFVGGKPAYLFDVTNPSWKPTLKLGHTDCSHPGSNAGRYERQQKRQLDKQQPGYTLQQTSGSPSAPASLHDQEDDCSTHTSCCTQTDILFSSLTTVEEKLLREELNRLNLENMNLKDELNKKQMNLESLRDNDESVRYFTGISSFLTLVSILDFILPHLPSDKRRLLSPFQSFLMTVMHLRLNTPLKHLAFIFNVSRVTASKVFQETLFVMHQRLKPMIFWPDRQHIRTSLPRQFLQKPWNRVVSIIDCFEVFIERPSCPSTSALTWSNYKHNNTIKYLISITPQGFISFVSKGWGGRTSDKMVTEKSGFLDNLLPNDLVLADRGFDISDLVATKGAEVKIPNFTRGKSQLHAHEVESTRNLANLRIHVERVIGLVSSKYTILNSTVPVELLYKIEGSDMTSLDQIVEVGCALVNLCDGII